MSRKTIILALSVLVSGWIVHHLAPLASADALPLATFTEQAVSFKPGAGSSGMNDNLSEIITLDKTLDFGGGFIRSYQAEVRTSGGDPPTADVQGEGKNVQGATALAQIRFRVGVKAPSNPAIPVTNIRLKTTARANLVASIADDDTLVNARARVSVGNSGLKTLGEISCKVGSDCSTVDVTNATFFDFVKPGNSMGIFKEAFGAIGGITVNHSGTGSFQVVVDPFVEIDPTFTVNIPGIGTVFAKDYYELEFSPNLDVTRLRAGDADQDLDFDQLDLVQVQIAGKYLSGQSATWGEGDWNSAPGGSPGNPPQGNGLFDQGDIVAALQAGTYLSGPYAAIAQGGVLDDDQTSVVYDANTGNLSVDAPAGMELTSINISSAGGKFVGGNPAVLDGAFDNFAADNIFKATIGGSFGSISFGSVLLAGIAENDLAADLSIVGSLAGGGDLGDVDFVYVPEPASALMLVVGIVMGLFQFNRIGDYKSSWYAAECRHACGLLRVVFFCLHSVFAARLRFTSANQPARRSG